ncbi:hypothetical protein [Sediminispirochaeta bajacaliforniensis]|nr:hypothetical protein [Sediminispirochaeta bajacaliforniensis]
MNSFRARQAEGAEGSPAKPDGSRKADPGAQPAGPLLRSGAPG